MRTELERATRRLLELVVNQLPVGVLVVSATGHRIVANAGARRLLAADVAPSSPHPLMAQLRETLRTGQAEQARGLGIAPWPSWLTGDAVHVDSQTRPLIDGQGRTIGALLTVADVTTYVLRAQQLEDQMGMVSHDLRTPLGLITMCIAALLRQPCLEPSLVRGLRRIQDAAERATRMSGDLLDLTRVRRSGQIPITRVPGVDLDGVVDAAADEVRAGFPARTLERRRDGQVAGDWDADRLFQVAANLIANAFKYSPEETPVRVATHGDADNGYLEVHNQGEPIAPERLDHLFGPSSDQRPVGVAASRGGLGLFIVDQIIRSHAGAIAVESAREHGTSFVVRLPRRPPP